VFPGEGYYCAASGNLSVWPFAIVNLLLHIRYSYSKFCNCLNTVQSLNFDFHVNPDKLSL